MAWVYILKGSSGRHYIGSTVDVQDRFGQHKRGHTYTTKRLGEALEIVASKEFPTLTEARRIERMLKRKKNPRGNLLFAVLEQPRKLSGLVGSSTLPPGKFRALGWAESSTLSWQRISASCG
jgi:predicted GIY-YIG superfamily endonuclease